MNKHFILNILPDSLYLKLLYKKVFRKKLDLKNPKTFNEKIQWLKLYDRKNIYTTLVDKYEVKKYVSNLIGEEYVIPTLGVWNSFEEIDFSKLPSQFVLKTTHDSGGVVIVNNKDDMDFAQAKKTIDASLSNNYYKQGREWPYKNVKPRIIAEEYMVDESGYELKDYKFFCFNGCAKVMFIASDRQSNYETKFDFYDMDFNHLPFLNGHPNSEKNMEKPETFEEMRKLAEILSKGIPQVRIDFYSIRNKVYFGEVTFSHWSGFVPFDPEEWDLKLGQMITLPSKNK